MAKRAKQASKTSEAPVAAILIPEKVAPKGLFTRKGKRADEVLPVRDTSATAHRVHFDGSQPWTPNLVEVNRAATFEPIEGFSPEEKLSILKPIFWTRQGILIPAGLLSLVLSNGFAERMSVGLLFILLALPVSIATRFSLMRRVEFPIWLPAADGVVAALLVFVSPQMFEVAVVLISIQLIAMRPAFHMPVIGTAMIVSYGGIGAVALTHRPINSTGFGVLSMAAFFVPIICKLAHHLQVTEIATHRKYLDLLGGLDAVAWEADPETLELVTVSPQVRNMFGFERAIFVRNWKEYIHPDDQEIEEAARRGVVQSGHKTMAIDFRMINSDGETIFVRNVIAVERDLSGKVARVRGVLSDVSSQHEAENTIRKQAQYDALTGLPNRSLFNEQLRRRLDDARLTNETLSVHLLDLNGFKEVNDTLGHAVGDVLLQAIAGRLAAYLPDRSLVARLGGDEFAVVTFPANADTAQNVAEAIGAALQPPVTVDDMTIQAGASTGIAMFPSDGDSAQSLLRRADAAMYEAKQAGRNFAFAAPDDDEANMRRLQLLGELRSSIAGGDFRLYHQPKIDAYTGQVVGTEGLIRWHHKQYGLLTPGAFVELSELSGLIQPLTRWVIEQGIRDLAEWRKSGFGITVALNLSVRNFFDQGLPSYIAELLREYKVPGSQLVLEITESEVMSDRNLARTALSAFRSLGVKIAIDDFGTGFSSLSQLQQLPIDEIKVDQSFVSGMLDNEQDHVIVRSIIDLAHNLSLQIVAEGAETPEQLQALRDMRADRIQGYVISKPLPREDFFRWLSNLQPVLLNDGVRRVRVAASLLGLADADIPLHPREVTKPVVPPMLRRSKYDDGPSVTVAVLDTDIDMPAIVATPAGALAPWSPPDSPLSPTEAMRATRKLAERSGVVVPEEVAGRRTLAMAESVSDSPRNDDASVAAPVPAFIAPVITTEPALIPRLPTPATAMIPSVAPAPSGFTQAELAAQAASAGISNPVPQSPSTSATPVWDMGPKETESSSVEQLVAPAITASPAPIASPARIASPQSPAQSLEQSSAPTWDMGPAQQFAAVGLTPVPEQPTFLSAAPQQLAPTLPAREEPVSQVSAPPVSVPQVTSFGTTVGANAPVWAPFAGSGSVVAVGQESADRPVGVDTGAGPTTSPTSVGQPAASPTVPPAMPTFSAPMFSAPPKPLVVPSFTAPAAVSPEHRQDPGPGLFSATTADSPQAPTFGTAKPQPHKPAFGVPAAPTGNELIAPSAPVPAESKTDKGGTDNGSDEDSSPSQEGIVRSLFTAL